MKIEVGTIYRDKNYEDLKVKIQKIYSPDHWEYKSYKEEIWYKGRAKIVEYLKTTLISRDEPFSQDCWYCKNAMTVTDFKRNFKLY